MSKACLAADEIKLQLNRLETLNKEVIESNIEQIELSRQYKWLVSKLDAIKCAASDISCSLFGNSTCVEC